MSIVSPELNTMQSLISQGQQPWRNITASNRQIVRLETGEELFYWGLRTDIRSLVSRVAVGFGLQPSSKQNDCAWRLENSICFGYLFTQQDGAVLIQPLEVVSCDDHLLVLRVHGGASSFLPTIC